MKGLVEYQIGTIDMASTHLQTHGTEFVIVTATEADGSQIQSITARAGVFSQEEVECARELWGEFLTDGSDICGYNFIVYRDDDQVLGFACYGPRDLTDGTYDLYWIAVDPAVRCNGVGRALLTASEEAVRQMGGRMLIAETSGTPHYETTRKFYFRMGYKNEAIIKDFYATSDDLMIFIKRI